MFKSCDSGLNDRPAGVLTHCTDNEYQRPHKSGGDKIPPDMERRKTKLELITILHEQPFEAHSSTKPQQLNSSDNTVENKRLNMLDLKKNYEISTFWVMLYQSRNNICFRLKLCSKIQQEEQSFFKNTFRVLSCY